MANTAIANISLALNTQKEMTTTAAVADTANLAEVFDFSPKSDGKSIVVINNVSALNGSVTYSISVGDFYAGTVAKTGTIEQGKSYILQLESAKYMQADGKINITITPASGKKLKTDHALTVTAIQLV